MRGPLDSAARSRVVPTSWAVAENRPGPATRPLAGSVPLGGVSDLPQPVHAQPSLGHEALDGREDVVGSEVGLVDDLVDRAAGAPAVVPVGRQRVVARDRARRSSGASSATPGW